MLFWVRVFRGSGFGLWDYCSWGRGLSFVSRYCIVIFFLGFIIRVSFIDSFRVGGVKRIRRWGFRGL